MDTEEERGWIDLLNWQYDVVKKYNGPDTVSTGDVRTKKRGVADGLEDTQPMRVEVTTF